MPRARRALAMTSFFARSAIQSRAGRPGGRPLRMRNKGCGKTGRCGERTERCRWQRKRSERVAAVKILSVRRKAAQKFWAPQQDHRPLRRVIRGAVRRDDVGIVPYGWYAGCENRTRSCSVPGEVSLFVFIAATRGGPAFGCRRPCPWRQTRSRWRCRRS